jgi:hypothetical protein
LSLRNGRSGVQALERPHFCLWAWRSFSDKIRVWKGRCAMSSSSGSASWLDKWWQVLVILLGIGFALVLGNFSPQI